MFKLNEISIFDGLSDEEARGIAGHVTEERFDKKALIFSEGDRSDWFYIVREGKVKITKLSADGKEIILEIIHPREFFGGIAALRGFPYPANAVAMEDSVLMKIPRQKMVELLERFPEVMMRLVKNIGDRIKDSHETTKNIALEKVGPRIAALLLKLADKTGTEAADGVELEMKLTKQDIAEMVGTTVETAIRTMSHFKKLGLVAERSGKIVIKDRPGLEAILL